MYSITSHYPHEPRLYESLNSSSNSLTQGVKVRSSNHIPNMKICKVCNESLLEDKYHLLIAYSIFIVKFTSFGAHVKHELNYCVDVFVASFDLLTSLSWILICNIFSFMNSFMIYVCCCHCVCGLFMNSHLWYSFIHVIMLMGSFELIG